jgi:hypothetical protein
MFFRKATLMHKKISLVLLFIMSLILSSCKQGSQKVHEIEFDSLNMGSKELPLNPFDTIGQGLPIFYNMYLSVELSSLFETAGAVFTSELMNSEDRTSEYLTSSQQAVNLGVYAVDLSYARVFDQVETAGRYFNAMKSLSQELGIPADYFENTVKRFERNFTDKDSLIYLANEVYMTTDQYLKENERYTTAAMIILGGWIEAIHIAIDVAIESKDINIIERLIDQKYSLNNLMIMLSEHQKNEIIAGYLLRLKSIKNDFNKINVDFDINIDPESPEGKALITKSIEQIQNLRRSIETFRKELIN